MQIANPHAGTCARCDPGEAATHRVRSTPGNAKRASVAPTPRGCGTPGPVSVRLLGFVRASSRLPSPRCEQPAVVTAGAGPGGAGAPPVRQRRLRGDLRYDFPVFGGDAVGDAATTTDPSLVISMRTDAATASQSMTGPTTGSTTIVSGSGTTVNGTCSAVAGGSGSNSGASTSRARQGHGPSAWAGSSKQVLFGEDPRERRQEQRVLEPFVAAAGRMLAFDRRPGLRPRSKGVATRRRSNRRCENRRGGGVDNRTSAPAAGEIRGRRDLPCMATAPRSEADHRQPGCAVGLGENLNRSAIHRSPLSKQEDLRALTRAPLLEG